MADNKTLTLPLDWFEVAAATNVRERVAHELMPSAFPADPDPRVTWYKDAQRRTLELAERVIAIVQRSEGDS